MTDLPDVRPCTVVTESDLRSAFLGLDSGWYRSADLLPRYLAWAKQNGKPEVTTKVLGQSISREFKSARRRQMAGNVSAWWLDEAVLTNRDWFKS